MTYHDLLLNALFQKKKHKTSFWKMGNSDTNLWSLVFKNILLLLLRSSQIPSGFKCIFNIQRSAHQDDIFTLYPSHAWRWPTMEVYMVKSASPTNVKNWSKHQATERSFQEKSLMIALASLATMIHGRLVGVYSTASWWSSLVQKLTCELAVFFRFGLLWGSLTNQAQTLLVKTTCGTKRDENASRVACQLKFANCLQASNMILVPWWKTIDLFHFTKQIWIQYMRRPLQWPCWLKPHLGNRKRTHLGNRLT